MTLTNTPPLPLPPPSHPFNFLIFFFLRIWVLEGAKPLPAQGVGRYSTGVRPASQRAVFKVRRVCQHGSRRLPGSLCLSWSRSWFLAFSGRGVWSLLPRDSASPPPHPLPSPSSCLAALLSHQVSFVVFERLYEFLVDFKTAVRFRTYHFVVSVSVRDALRP